MLKTTVNVEFENAVKEMLEGSEWELMENGKIVRRDAERKD